MDNNMKLYYDYTLSPLGTLFYKSVWAQLGNLHSENVLDFGSGFAFTANHLAKTCNVTAVEPSENIIKHAFKSNAYTQINGDLSALKSMESEKFDIVLCHLVLEFVQNPKDIVKELTRVLKKGGVLSIVRHNRNGRLIQAVVQDYDLSECKKLLNGENSYSSAFGGIRYYENDDILNWSENALQIDKLYAVRALASLHGDDVQKSENWLKDMLCVEKELELKEEFIKIAYFNHLIFKK